MHSLLTLQGTFAYCKWVFSSSWNLKVCGWVRDMITHLGEGRGCLMPLIAYTVIHAYAQSWVNARHNEELLGRSLMIGWRKNSWNPERVPSVVTLCVRPSVRARPTGHIFWPKNLICWLNDPWDMRKKRIFLFFEIFIFTLSMDIFRFFLYITLVKCWFQATGHSFST